MTAQFAGLRLNGPPRTRRAPERALPQPVWLGAPQARPPQLARPVHSLLAAIRAAAGNAGYDRRTAPAPSRARNRGGHAHTSAPVPATADAAALRPRSRDPCRVTA